MMKIAVPVTENNEIDDHFGHCAFYAIYSITETNTILNIETLEAEQGCGCKSNIANTLAEHGVKTMLAGGIGNGAINVLDNAGIDVVRGCSGNPTDIVALFLQGLLVDSGLSCAEHDHHHEHGHQCNH
jgi:predicted Fe-Mo cluster-binding NifX family protein